MGGLFRAPQPVMIEAPPEPVQQQSVAQAEAATAAAAETAARAERAQAAARARRGLGGTIATSPRGVLEPLPFLAVRKTLLGE
jgi:hypothetical protein